MESTIPTYTFDDVKDELFTRRENLLETMVEKKFNYKLTYDFLIRRYWRIRSEVKKEKRIVKIECKKTELIHIENECKRVEEIISDLSVKIINYNPNY